MDHRPIVNHLRRAAQDRLERAAQDGAQRAAEDRAESPAQNREQLVRGQALRGPSSAPHRLAVAADRLNHEAVASIKATPVSCDQAIFTSIRSPMGEGYRVVAASPGVKPLEKAEITRYSPSHGGLSGQSPHTVGLLAYPLSSGRYCVSHCRYAGVEHTARGGQRVWTHLAVLDAETYQAFGCNPLRVHKALSAANAAIPPSPRLMVLQALTLEARSRSETPPPVFSEARAEAFTRVVSALLQGGRWIVCGSDHPRSTLEWAFDMVPVQARAELSVSIGLGFALSRRLNLAWINGDEARTSHIIRGHDIRWCDLDAGQGLEPSAFDAWLALVRDRSIKGRLPGISRMAARIVGGAEPATLRRIAHLCTDTDLAQSKDEAACATLRAKYASFVPDDDLEQELATKLLSLLKPTAEE